MNEKSKYIYDHRRYILAGVVIVVLLVFLMRLFSLQIFSDDYKKWADSNAFQRLTLYPARGVVYDRKGNLLVYNQPSYDVMVIMREIKHLDTLDFCQTVGITKDFFDERIAAIKDRALNPGYSPYVSQVFLSQLSVVEYGVLYEKLYKFSGFFIRPRPLREFGCSNAAHILGSLGKVKPEEIAQDDYYVPEDNAGRSGIERSYEKILRGEKGVEILLRDTHGRIKGKYENGEHDIAPVSGKNLTLSIDMELQAYGEKIMKNKPGAIVMIEPSTGEILCLVSWPTYDPNLLIGREGGFNYLQLMNNPLRPLFDRSIMGAYSPGSTFKPAQALIFLQEGVVTKEKTYPCYPGYSYTGGSVGCHLHPSPISLIPAISTSCNAYFCWGLHDLLDSRSRYKTVQEAFEKWRNYMVSMGFGHPLGVDLPSERRSSMIPNSQFYDNAYNNRWSSGSIISTAIGQGEILATPLQICNLAATIANRGYYIVPHVVHSIQDMELEEKYRTPKYTDFKQEYYEYIVEGMRAAVTNFGGTCGKLYLSDLEVCAKTGTIQNPHGRNHSACIAFAPKNNPRIAIAVYVENGGAGSLVAVPLARLMLHQFFHNEIPEYDKWLEREMLNWSTLPGTTNYIKKPGGDSYAE